jgi:hypothetical protein
MRYPPARLAEVDAPVAKLLGTYECELHPVFEQARGPFFDVGSADGYYAVGMARRGHPVVAWDMSRNARLLCADVARLNGVTIDQRTKYTGDPIHDGLVLVDIEGAESSLLTASVASTLPTVLVEVHDHLAVGTGDRLCAAFDPTHSVRRIDQAPRVVPPALDGWTETERERALSEFRPPGMYWLVFTRR